MKHTAKLFLISTLLLSGCNAPQETITPLTQPVVNAQNVNNNTNNSFTVREISNKLRNLETRYISLLNPYEREQARREISDIYYLLNQLNNGNPTTPINSPMSDAEFITFYNRVKAQPFQDDKINMIKTVVKMNWFTVNQISQLILIFTFESDRIKALEATYAKATDKKNGYLLLDLFRLEKEYASKIIASYAGKTDENSNTPVQTPSSTTPVK